jgi:hypothetical protein
VLSLVLIHLFLFILKLFDVEFIVHIVFVCSLFNDTFSANVCYLFIYGLFNDAVSSSDFLASDNSLINE